MGYQCGIGAMQLPAALSPSARLPWPLVEMDCSLCLVSGAGKPGRRGALTDLFMSIFATPDPKWLRSRLNCTRITEVEVFRVAEAISVLMGIGHPNPAVILEHQPDVGGAGGFRGKLFPAQLYVQWIKTQHVCA